MLKRIMERFSEFFEGYEIIEWLGWEGISIFFFLGNIESY